MAEVVIDLDQKQINARSTLVSLSLDKASQQIVDKNANVIVTMLIGIAGAFAGGWLSQLVPFLASGNPGSGWLPSPGSVVTATIGAVLLLAIYRRLKK